MPIIYNKVQNLQERVDAALADDFKHNAIETAQNTFHAKRALLVEQLPMWEDYRDACKAISMPCSTSWRKQARSPV